MTLFIAILLLIQIESHWSGYLFACGLWAAHLVFHVAISE